MQAWVVRLARRRLQWLAGLGAKARALVVGVTLVPPIVLLFGTTAWVRCGWQGCPNVDRLRSYQPGKASRLLDREGRPFAELRPLAGRTAPLARVPRHVRDAFLAVEDRRFYLHGAVDWRRVAGATVHNLRRRRAEQGFSTITMQLARNVFPDRIHGEEQTLGRKLLEIRVAYDIERRFGKDEILELYLSHIYFGNGARGIAAAASHYFGSTAERLTLSQGALLAALIRGPAYYDPRRHPERAKERRDLVLRLMERQGLVSAAEARRARGARLGVVPRRPWAGVERARAAWFVEEVRRQIEDRFGERTYDETLDVFTTLDSRFQRAAEEALEWQLRRVEAGALGRFGGPRYAPSPAVGDGSPYLQGAVVALAADSGDVLAWVGGRDFRHSRFDRVKSSRRQLGSAFKPFVFAAALAEGHYLSEPLEDEPLRVRLAAGRYWEPKNFDEEYDGVVTLREALVRSKNLPTLRLADAVGIGRVARLARESGIRSRMDETPAMPLGTVAVSPLELASAYGAFASLGELISPRLVLSVRDERGEEIWRAERPKRERVLDAGVAFLVTDVLRDALERGTGAAARAAGFGGEAAGKTGTTNDGTDAWFVGYTPSLVASVWIGFDNPRPIMAAATGSRLAAPVWGRMMARAGDRSGPSWQAPTAVVARWVDPDSGAPLQDGCRPADGWALRELFLVERMPDRVCPERGELYPAETYPAPSDEEEGSPFDLWPDELPGSEAAPPPAEEEVEPSRAERGGWRWPRDQDRADRMEEEERRLSQEAERLARERRREAERRLRQWRRQWEKRLQEWLEQRHREHERG